jgi:hypothetical protein
MLEHHNHLAGILKRNKKYYISWFLGFYSVRMSLTDDVSELLVDSMFTGQVK